MAAVAPGAVADIEDRVGSDEALVQGGRHDHRLHGRSRIVDLADIGVAPDDRGHLEIAFRIEIGRRGHDEDLAGLHQLHDGLRPDGLGMRHAFRQLLLRLQLQRLVECQVDMGAIDRIRGGGAARADLAPDAVPRAVDEAVRSLQEAVVLLLDAGRPGLLPVNEAEDVRQAVPQRILAPQHALQTHAAVAGAVGHQREDAVVEADALHHVLGAARAEVHEHCVGVASGQFRDGRGDLRHVVFRFQTGVVEKDAAAGLRDGQRTPRAVADETARGGQPARPLGAVAGRQVAQVQIGRARAQKQVPAEQQDGHGPEAQPLAFHRHRVPPPPSDRTTDPASGWQTGRAGGRRRRARRRDARPARRAAAACSGRGG